MDQKLLQPQQTANGIKQTVAVNSKKMPLGTPLFLRKSYDMISTCDTTIASWYDDGTTFVVKDQNRFVAEVIPKYFKHSNFSSFVRQLNFYGFRKIKCDPLRIKENSEESNYWKFRHDNFQRDRPDLLSQICKRQNEPADKQDVENLCIENQELRNQLDIVYADVVHLKRLVDTLMKTQEVVVQTNQALFQAEEAAAKRPRLQSFTSSVTTTFHSPTEASITPTLLLPGNEAFISQQLTTNQLSSASVTSGADDDVLALLVSIDPLDELMLHDAFATQEDTVVSETSDSNVDQNLIDTVREALDRLPVQMQSIFVDRLVAAVVNPDALQKQTDSITTLIGCAVDESQRRLIAAGRQPNDKHMPCIATVILNAFLARSSEQQQYEEAMATVIAATTTSTSDITSLPNLQPF